jgi:hypothetical protein
MQMVERMSYVADESAVIIVTVSFGLMVGAVLIIALAALRERIRRGRSAS